MSKQYVVKKIDFDNSSDINMQLKEFEKEFVYPLGQDNFCIDHGENYLNFFSQLGRPLFYACFHHSKVVGLGAGILRKISLSDGKMLNCWYLCDLKVSKSHRGNFFAAKMFAKALPLNYIRCGRGYAVSMDRPDGSNPVVKLTEKLPWVPLKATAKLYIYSIKGHEFLEKYSSLQSIFPTMSLKNNAGSKDIILQSSQTSLPLIHISFDHLGTAIDILKVHNETQYMFCLVSSDARINLLNQMNIIKMSTATIVSHRMKHVDWSFINTSEI